MAMTRMPPGIPIIRPLHFLSLPPDIRALIFSHLFENKTEWFVAPRKDSFILLAPKPTARRVIRGLTPEHVRLPTSVLYVCRQVNREATESLFQSNILSTSFWTMERVTMSEDSSIPDVPPALRLDLVTVFEITIRVVPGFVMDYYSSLTKLSSCIECMMSLKVLRLGVAEFQSTEVGPGRLHAWSTPLINALEAIIAAVPRRAHVHVMDGEETGVAQPPMLVVEKNLVEMIVDGGTTEVIEMLKDGQNFETYDQIFEKYCGGAGENGGRSYGDVF